MLVSACLSKGLAITDSKKQIPLLVPGRNSLLAIWQLITAMLYALGGGEMKKCVLCPYGAVICSLPLFFDVR